MRKRTKEYRQLFKEWKAQYADLKKIENKLSRACVHLHASDDMEFLTTIRDELTKAHCRLGRLFYEKATRLSVPDHP